MVFEISAESEQYGAGYRQAERLQEQASQQRLEHQQLAERLRNAAQADAALHAILRRSYPGRHDVLDALWWRAHPLTATPAGRPDPAAELPAVQAAVYSRSRSTESASDDEERLSALQRALDQDTADLDDLLDHDPAFTHGPPVAGAPETGPLSTARVRKVPSSTPHNHPFRALADGTDVWDGSGDGEGAAGTPTATGTAEPGGFSAGSGSGPKTGAPRRMAALRPTALLLAGAAAGALAVLVLQASGLAAATVSAGGTVPTPESSETAGPTASATVLQIFDEPSTIPATETANLDGYTSIHELFAPTDGSTAPYHVFAARKGGTEYCLIVQAFDLSGTHSCTTLDVLSQTGLSLEATVRIAPGPAGDLATTLTAEQFVDLSIIWDSNGGIGANTYSR